MRGIFLLARSKETDRKLRWAGEVDGVPFELYVPKEQVPDPWPGRICVEIQDIDEAQQFRDGVRVSLEDPIVERVRWYKNLTQTARYRPSGDSSSWQIGEPYIPYVLLADPPQRELLIRILWDNSIPWKWTE